MVRSSAIRWTGTLRTRWGARRSIGSFSFVAENAELSITERELPWGGASVAALAMWTDAAPRPSHPSRARARTPNPIRSGSRTQPPPRGRRLRPTAPATVGVPIPSARSRSLAATTAQCGSSRRSTRVVTRSRDRHRTVHARPGRSDPIHRSLRTTRAPLRQRIEDFPSYARLRKRGCPCARRRSNCFPRMTRLVRELSAKTAETVQLECGRIRKFEQDVIGAIDRPYYPIIRNSSITDRGPCGPAGVGNRKPHDTAGRPRSGRRIVIAISDCGGGNQFRCVLRRRAKRSRRRPMRGLNPDENQHLSFLPGLSRRPVVLRCFPARGVVIDVVRRNIQDLGPGGSRSSPSPVPAACCI